MTDTEDVQRYADAIMAMIKQDQDTGQVPRDVCSWDELDDTVDARAAPARRRPTSSLTAFRRPIASWVPAGIWASR